MNYILRNYVLYFQHSKINYHTPLSSIINDITKTIRNKSYKKISKKNKTRLDNIIYYTNDRFGKSKTNEYFLMQNFLNKRQDLYLLAIEYEFDEGGCNIQQHGDMILIDTSNNLYITECKFIKEDKQYSVKKREYAFEQAHKCHKRFVSWIEHISKFDKSKIIIQEQNIYPCVLINDIFYIYKSNKYIPV